MWDLIVSVPDHCLSFYFQVRMFVSFQDGPLIGPHVIYHGLNGGIFGITQSSRNVR